MRAHSIHYLEQIRDRLDPLEQFIVKSWWNSCVCVMLIDVFVMYEDSWSTPGNILRCCALYILQDMFNWITWWPLTYELPTCARQNSVTTWLFTIITWHTKQKISEWQTGCFCTGSVCRLALVQSCQVESQWHIVPKPSEFASWAQAKIFNLQRQLQKGYMSSFIAPPFPVSTRPWKLLEEHQPFLLLSFFSFLQPVCKDPVTILSYH